MVGAPPATQPNERREACTHRGRPERPSVCVRRVYVTPGYTHGMLPSAETGRPGDTVTYAYWASVREGSRPSSSQDRDDSLSNDRRLARGSLGHRLQCGVTSPRRRA